MQRFAEILFVCLFLSGLTSLSAPTGLYHDGPGTSYDVPSAYKAEVRCV